MQCLLNAPLLTSFFQSGEFRHAINRTNPMGCSGRMADEWGVLIDAAWSGRVVQVAPRALKHTLGELQPRFAGYRQQDSSELLAFLLDGLHEDLNLVLDKPFVPTPVFRPFTPDVERARVAWDAHLQRNRSVIVDHFQGQIKSRLTCPSCLSEQVTFDAFMQLTLPVPSLTPPPPVGLQSAANSSANSAAPGTAHATGRRESDYVEVHINYKHNTSTSKH